jgi:hypothetical protein
MRVQELWVESYQGEVLGETIFGWLAAHEYDEERRHQLETLTLLERATKDLAEPVFDRLGYDRGDTEATVKAATTAAEWVAEGTWEQFLAGTEAVAAQYLLKYEELVGLTTEAFEREIAVAYVAHEKALAAFARRAQGKEEGEALAPILELPHVAAAASA